jgi:hypothetical protein
MLLDICSLGAASYGQFAFDITHQPISRTA